MVFYGSQAWTHSSLRGRKTDQKNSNLVSFQCIAVGRRRQLCNLSPTCSSGEHLQFPGQTVLGEPCVKRSREWGAGWKTPGLPFQSVTPVTVWDSADLVNSFCLSISRRSKTKGRSCEQHETPYIPADGWNIQLGGENRLVSMLVLMFKSEIITWGGQDAPVAPFSYK